MHAGITGAVGEHRTLYLWLKRQQIAPHQLEVSPGESIMKRGDFLTKGTVAAGLASSAKLLPPIVATQGGAPKQTQAAVKAPLAQEDSFQ
jgi:hypothetical protein